MWINPESEHIYYHCSLIMSKKSRWYTILSKTEPNARPSCRLNVAENPMISILCLGGAAAELKTSSSEPLAVRGLLILELK